MKLEVIDIVAISIMVMVVVAAIVLLGVKIYSTEKTKFIGIDPGNTGGLLECKERTVTRYMIADGDSVVELEQSVSELLKEGLEPLGGIVINNLNGLTTSREFVQAMVKYN